jgi:hypothetical protein
VNAAPVAHVAAHNFHQHDEAWWNHWRYEAPEPRDADFNYRHGWVHLEGQAFCRAEVMLVGAPQPWWID